MEIDVTTPALLFPTISLLLLAYTNRFLGLAKTIRDLYQIHQTNPQQRYVDQIDNLRRRVGLIRDMQSLGVSGLLLCTVCMMFIVIGWVTAANVAFAVSLFLMVASLAMSIVEIRMSVGALNLHLADMELAQPNDLHDGRRRWFGGFGRFSVASILWMSLVVAILVLWYRDRVKLDQTLASIYGGNRTSWSIDQIIGQPDTQRQGDVPTAWASRLPDSGSEWIVVEFPIALNVATIEIYESYNPGAVTKISSVSATGAESVLWQGTDPLAMAGRTLPPPRSTFKLSKPTSTRRLKIEIASGAFPGWNEIDAVAILDASGKREWVTQAWASSSFGTNHEMPSWFWP